MGEREQEGEEEERATAAVGSVYLDALMNCIQHKWVVMAISEGGGGGGGISIKYVCII